MRINVSKREGAKYMFVYVYAYICVCVYKHIHNGFSHIQTRLKAYASPEKDRFSNDSNTTDAD